MLKVNKALRSVGGTPESALGLASTDPYKSFIRTLNRQFWLVVVIIGCATSLGFLYLFLTPPSFTATSTMVIDTRKIQVLQQQSVLGDAVVDAGIVQTELEIIKSPKISLSVINNLRLTKDPEFNSSGGGPLSVIRNFIFGAPKPDEKSSGEEQLIRRTLAAFDNRRTVSRVGTTYVMEIRFRSLDPKKSAEIANAVSTAYIADQLQAKYEATVRATVWLQQRITELRSQVSAADRAVVDFKRANNIIESGNGRLMNEQQLSEVSSQLILARAETAAAKARLERIQDVMKQEIVDASVADGLHSEVIIRLRNQYLDYAARERIFADRYGTGHLATVNLRTLMQEIRHNIDDEMKKIAEGAKSDYEIATTRELSLEKSLANSVSDSLSTRQAQIQLRELESNSQAYRTVYDSFLQRYMESVQQQSFPITEARVIGAAATPTEKSQPNTLLVLALSTAAGVMVSIAAGYLREATDRGFRTSSQIEEVLQTNCIATLPSVKVKKNCFSTEFDESDQKVERTVVNKHPLLQYVIEEPLSRYAEGIRSLKVVMDLNSVLRSNKVIGFTSTLPDEGKSTIASNFAHLLAHAGRRTILIDADLRNPSLSRRLVPGAKAVGLVEVISGRIAFEDAVWTEPSTGLFFLPTDGSSKLIHTDEILGSEGMKNFVDGLREVFDYVIVDFPPLAPVIDTRATTSFIDYYVYVVEWARTNRDIAEQLLTEATEIHDRLLGVILNKANMSTMSRYEGYRNRYHYRKSNARYGYLD